MPTGKLGGLDLAATTAAQLYQAPTGRVATITVAMTNRNEATAKLRIALSAAGVLAGAIPATDWLEYDVPVAGNGVLERTGIVVGADQQVFVEADTANVTAIAYGFEEAE